MSEPGTGLEPLLRRLQASDDATRAFIRQEIAAQTRHEREMDQHEIRQRYVAQAISFVLPMFGLVIALVSVLNGLEIAASVIGGLDILGIVTAMWAGIRRNAG